MFRDTLVHLNKIVYLLPMPTRHPAIWRPWCVLQGLLTLVTGGREASVSCPQPQQLVANAERTEEEWKQDLCKGSEKATAAAAVVQFVGACLDLLSVSPVGSLRLFIVFRDFM